MTATTNPWARWRVRLGYPVALLFAALAHPLLESLAWGAAVALLGLAIRAAAAGHLYKHARLATTGPYRYTRNPLYFGSALMAAGLLLAGRSWIAAALVAVYFAVFYTGVMRTEEGELRARYGGDFDAYAQRVPRFFPALTPRVPAVAGQKFSWGQYGANREYQAAIGLLIGLALLYVRMKFPS